MKTIKKHLTIIVFCLFSASFVLQAQTYSQVVYNNAEHTSGSLTLKKEDCANQDYISYYWVIDVPVNMPVRVSASLDYYISFGVYCSGTPNSFFLSQPGNGSDTFITSSGIISVYCEGDIIDEVWSDMFTLTFEVDYTYVTDERTHLPGELSVNSRLGVRGNVTIGTLETRPDTKMYLYAEKDKHVYGLYSTIAGVSDQKRWAGYFYGGDLEVEKGRLITSSLGRYSPDVSYNGQVVVSKVAAAAQYINLVRHNEFPWSIGMVYNTNKFAIGPATTNESEFTNPYFVIDNTNGNIGIGNANPQYKLDVRDWIYANHYAVREAGRITYLPQRTFVHNSKIMGRYAIGWYNDSWSAEGYAVMWQSGYDGIKFFTRDQVRMAVDKEGYVGIGTTNPQYMLDVKGVIRATEVIIESISDFPDYVFGKDYMLRPLSEVNSFIQKNGHLPEIPSAAEVEENGVSLAEMQVKLLQKIEELTLYVIDQQREIEELKKQVSTSNP